MLVYFRLYLKQLINFINGFLSAFEALLFLLNAKALPPINTFSRFELTSFSELP